MIFKKKDKEPWDGNGTGLWCAIKRWWYTRMRGYVVLREFDVTWDLDNPKKDDEVFDCWLKHRLVKKKDLPEDTILTWEMV